MELKDRVTEIYEKQQVIEITSWKSAEPSILSKVSGSLFKPVSWLVQNVIPENSIQSGIEACSGASKFLLDAEGFKQELNITTIAELKQKPLEFCDAQADNVHNWSVGIAAGEGAVTGVTGFIGLAADIPAIITIAFRTINKIGLCYGFENITEEDNNRVLSILSASGANTVQEKELALVTLKEIIGHKARRTVTDKTVANELSKEAGMIIVRGLAKQIGINLSRRKALQALPVLGAAVGASVNGAFINDVAWASRRVFQEAWLNEKYATVVTE